MAIPQYPAFPPSATYTAGLTYKSTDDDLFKIISDANRSQEALDSALYLSIHYNKIEHVYYLLGAGANPNTIFQDLDSVKGNYRRLHSVAQNATTPIKNVLSSHGLKDSIDMLVLPIPEGHYYRSILEMKGAQRTGQILAMLHYEKVNEYTLFFAVMEGDINRMLLALDAGASPYGIYHDQTTGRMDTILDIAYGLNNKDIINALEEHITKSPHSLLKT